MQNLRKGCGILEAGTCLVEKHGIKLKSIHSPSTNWYVVAKPLCLLKTILLSMTAKCISKRENMLKQIVCNSCQIYRSVEQLDHKRIKWDMKCICENMDAKNIFYTWTQVQEEI